MTTTTPTINNMTDSNPSELEMKAYNLVANTNCSFFLTGRAGTGKTTFLKRIQEEINKKFIVVAPTGIAALVAGGETIHSFFGFPLEILTRKSVIKISENKRRTILMADTIIVDEVSMVRCDIIDAIDSVLRYLTHSGLPFGGKQMIFSGDIYQLSPVVNKNDKTSMEMLRDLYNTEEPYFYKANVFRRMRMPAIEFQKVYRQTDAGFLKVLSNVREGKVSAEDLNMLNEKVGKEHNSEDMVITLTAHNKSADDINKAKLEAIDAPEFVFTGKINDSFKSKEYPVPMELKLKVGAQVMFCRNDNMHRWVNGSLAKVVELSDDYIKVELSNGTECIVPETAWESYEQTYNKETKKLEKKLVGSFVQYPLKLAWAITIHKSQGMTFDKLNIDLSRGVFMPGQLYVALSRLTSMDGLSLSSPVKAHYAMQNCEVKAFSSTFNNQGLIDTELSDGEALYPHLANGDYDAAACECLKLVVQKAENGDLRDAAIMAKKMFDIMVMDDCLIGTLDSPFLLSEPTTTNHFINAVLCLYSNQLDMAISYADLVLSRKADCREAMYIKDRALSLMERWREADEAGTTLIHATESAGEDYDCKTLMLIARVNMFVGDPVLGLLQRVIKYRSHYLPALLVLREFMKSKGVFLEGTEENNKLLEAFNDISVSDGDFTENCRKKMNTAEWGKMMNAVSNLSFE